jgi:SAM-dependent methyltransferase
MTAQAGYAFRDTDVAAERLALVDAVFAPTTRAFLVAHGAAQPWLAIDLGCGPGQTTRFLTRTLSPERVVGLDSSAAFVAAATANGVDAILHDVTVTPFPAGRADFLFARFLLTHLPAPAAVMRLWERELVPCGRLLVEDVESIETDDPVFARYLDTVRALLAQRGARLEIGAELAAAEPRVLRRRVNRVVDVIPDPRVAARMFKRNLQAWRDEVEPELAAELEAGLRARSHGSIAWRLRQIADEADCE